MHFLKPHVTDSFIDMSLCSSDVSVAGKMTRGKGHVPLGPHRATPLALVQSCTDLTSVTVEGSQSYLKPQPVGRSQRQPQSSETGRPSQV